MAKLQKQIFGLKLQPQVHVFTDDNKLYTIGDTAEIQSIVSDKLIEIQTLKI